MAALPPAGVNLQAQGFNKYIRQLDQIDKTQQEVFSKQSKGLDRSFDKAEKSARDYEKQLRKTNKTQQETARQQVSLNQALKGLAIGVGARELIEFGKESIELATIQAKAEAQLATAIQSTGGAANLSSRELKNLASELQGLTNFGDEATIQAQALLLTFKNIGGTTFPEATKAILDVSTAMNQDLKSTTIQVGKALNDPITGLSALTRVGIQFTQEQKDLVESLVETNRLAEAQAIILGELESQFGGSAEAARKADGGIIALGNAFGDLQEQIGFFIKGLNEASGVTSGLIEVTEQWTETIFLARNALGFGDEVEQLSAQIIGVQNEIEKLQRNREAISQGQRGLFVLAGEQIGIVDREEDIANIDEQISQLQGSLSDLELQQQAQDTEELATAQKNASSAINENTEAVKENDAELRVLQSSIQQAEQLELSFARAAEDSARKLARSQAKLAESQAKARLDLLGNQAEELENFEADRIKSIQDAEKEIAKSRQSAAKSRIRAQQNLQRQLRQNRERFNLTTIQSERRFQLEDRRLRAEGDILALQELRENFALGQQEASENFGLQQSQTRENTRDQIKEEQRQTRERQKELEDRLAQLKINLEQQRVELLTGFDEQETTLLESQAKQRQDQIVAYNEQQEDARINQARQLEDLGRSLAAQEELTAEGALAVATEIEGVFGQEGVADSIFTGFTDRTESKFKDLFRNIEQIISGSASSITISSSGGSSGNRARSGATGFPSFDDGGIVPGPRGSPQTIQAHGGETVLPTHRMSVPAIASQSLDVNMSGGFNITGGEQAGQVTVDAAIQEMTDTLEVAINRLVRRS